MSSKHVFPLILDGAVQAIATASSSKAWDGLTSYVTVAAAGGNFEMSLGAAEHAGTVVTVIKIDGSNTATVNPTTDFDSSAATVELNLDKESVSFMWDGSAWRLFQQDQSNSTAFTGGTVASATTFTAGSQNSAVARTATADGTGTGTIAAGTSFVSVTSGNADHIVVLPAPVVGNSIMLHVAANGYELRTNNPGSVKLNNVNGAGKELAVAANTVIRCTCVSSTDWIAEKISNVGAPAGGGTPD